MLSVTYGIYDKDKLVHSYSASVTRRNGKTLIETASPEIHKALDEVIIKINTDQTDERYLQNITIFLPKNIGSLRLNSFNFEEYLIEPYFSTNIKK